jgi:hypothetical protein
MTRKIALLLPLCFGLALSSSSSPMPFVSFSSLNEAVLSKNNNLDFLRDDGGKLGAFVVTDLPAGHAYDKGVSELRETAPRCLDESHLPVIELTDGSTRTTYATESAEFPDCIGDTMDVLSWVFDDVEALVSDLIEVAAGKQLFFDAPGSAAVRMKNGPRKDHVHVYRAAAEATSSEYLVPFHTDNGLFLLLTPFPEHPLRLRTSSGRTVSTEHVPADSVLVLYGLGLTDWLLQNNARARGLFHAVPHAVPALNADDVAVRSVYARMKVIVARWPRACYQSTIYRYNITNSS